MELIPPLEADLCGPVVRHFAEQGYDVAVEVYYNRRLADVVAVKGDRVVAVELKLRDWKGAFKQATAYQCCAHESYVALPLIVAVPLLAKRRLFTDEGVGLLAVNWPVNDVRCLIPAGANTRILPFAADGIRAAVDEALSLLDEDAAPET